MKHNRFMLVGASGSGKSTLIASFKTITEDGFGRADFSQVRKTQALIFDGQAVDTPGEYMENPRYYQAILATAQQVACVLLLQDAVRTNSVYPPGIARSFPCRVIGVVAKIDHPEADVRRAHKFLNGAGLNSSDIYCVSGLTGQGIAELKKRMADGQLFEDTGG